jgi:hypothetical protein
MKGQQDKSKWMHTKKIIFLKMVMQIKNLTFCIHLQSNKNGKIHNICNVYMPYELAALYHKL